MATYNISTLDVRYSSYSGLLNGDNFDLGGLSSFIIDASTVDINNVFFNNAFQTVILENTSTTQINIITFTGTFDGRGGTLELDGLLIDVGTANGTASQTFTIPSDASSNYPSYLGYCYIAGVLYTQATSFTNMHSDFRGRHFTYNNVTGQITFGDGANGDTPTGLIQIPNIFVESNTVNMIGGVVSGTGRAVFNSPNFSAGFICDVTSDWGVVNNSGTFQSDELTKHTYGSLNFIGIGSGNNVRAVFGEDTTGDSITFQTESNATTEVFESFNVPMWGDHEARIIAQRSSNFPRVRMYNDGGNATLKIYQGFGTVFTPRGGSGGSWDITFSDGYLRTDTSPYDLLHGRFDCSVSLFYRAAGAFTYATERRSIARCDVGEYFIGNAGEQIILPAAMQLDELFNLSGTSTGVIDNIQYNGTASSGSRDYNLFAEKGWRISNIEFPNDSDHGMQPEFNTEYQFVSVRNRTPVFSRNMSSSVIVTNAARTTGQVWLMPHGDAPNGSMLSGVKSDLIYSGSIVYFANIGTKTEVISNVLSGCSTVSAVTVNRSSTGNFAIEYKIWQITESEPASYKTLSLANVQADTSAYTTSTRWYFKYTVEKISGASNSGYISGISIDVTLDASFKWSPAPEDMSVVFGGDLQVNDYIRIENESGVTEYYDQVAAVPAIIPISGFNDGENWPFAVDRAGSSADTGSFAIVAGQTLPISVALLPYKQRNGDLMYSGSSSANVSISFDLVTPQATITINNAQVLPQVIFDEFEDALLTEDGMAWHSQQGSIIQWDDIIQGGKQLYLQSNIRLKGIGLNAGVIGMVGAFDDEIVDPTGTAVRFGAAYKEYTQADRDRDDAIKTKVDLIPENPLRDNDVRLDSYSTFDPSTDTVEGSETYDEALRLIRAEAAGKVSVTGDDVSFRDAQDTKDRITATTDAEGQRTAIVIDAS